MEKGKTVKIPIMMCNAKDLTNMDLNIDYDKSILKLLDVTKGSLNADALFEWNDVSPGKIKISFAGDKSISGTGSIGIMTFEVIGNTGKTGKTSGAGTMNKPPTSIDIIPGTITIGSPPIKGDCNGDNKLDEGDADMALLISVEKKPTDMCYDYNKDEKVDSLDARDVLKAIPGILKNLLGK
jgi:hypothetical protein